MRGLKVVEKGHEERSEIERKRIKFSEGLRDG